MSRAQDTSLTFSERLALRIHLLICRSCRRFSSQLSLLRNTLRAFSQHCRQGEASLSPLTRDQREKILKKLARALRKKK
ncbi:hypothetical protein ACFL6U_20380 [Planctomycetota bacterium]